VEYGEFTRRFREDQEIGRDARDGRVSIFRDNGEEVGVWREDRGTTCGRGDVLAADDAEMARDWFRTRVEGRDR